MNYLEILKEQFNNKIAFREKRPNVLQLIAPFYHEDGDMIDIFIEPVNGDPLQLKVCDHGMTLMRLSYSFNLDSPNKERIFRRILSENQISYTDDGNLFIETNSQGLYPAILQFAQTVAKVSNMELYKREVIQTLFYELLTEFIEEKLARYVPRKQVLPIPERDDLEVDFEFAIKPRPIFLFGVKDNAQARLAAISCLEFQRKHIPFRSVVVHEDFENLSRKDTMRITSASDKQFVHLEDFKSNALDFFSREVA